MKILTCAALCMAIVLAAPCAAEAEKKESTQILGWLEAGILKPGGARVVSKLDTGAKTSSMHALDIEIFKKNGEKHVRFRFDTSYDDDEDEHYDLTLERPLVREVIIKRHKKKNQVRPVVSMQICIAGKMLEGEFSLVDRSRFNYPVLLGRKLLADAVIVDPSAIFTREPDCSESDEN